MENKAWKKDLFLFHMVDRTGYNLFHMVTVVVSESATGIISSYHVRQI